MRPIIGVNGDCLWLCGDVCHSPPSLSAVPAQEPWEAQEYMLTGTGVGSNFRFVADLWSGNPPGLVSEDRTH